MCCVGLMPTSIMIVLALSVLFGLFSTTMMVVSVATDYWELTSWDAERLDQVENLNRTLSSFSPENSFYKVVLIEPLSTNQTYIEYFLRSTYGGIWRICDRITGEFRKTEEYMEAEKKAPFLRYDCFNYIPQYEERKPELDPKRGVWLVRMQNSGASCMIVSLMCLLTAGITGMVGLLQKQVSACMVTGVMYIVGGVFVCFGLVIMHTKVDYMKTGCSTLDPMKDLTSSVCNAKIVETGWSVPVAWVSFAFLIIASGFWLFLARCLRLEKAKSMI